VKRAVLLGALAGLIIALAFTLAMPSRDVTTIYIPSTHGQRVPVYGALQPYAPQALTVPTVERSPRTVRDALLGLLAGGLVAGVFVTVKRQAPRRGT
jgi:hypothetical protein